jgi:NADPH:quinone reductase-like Zn-dependent oxidoreductase
LGKMQEGSYVLITAAASSVGLAAIQLANAVGAIPIATTRNKAKEKSLQNAGAKFVINTTTDRWVEKVREITSGKGVDLAFDPVAGPELERVAQTMRSEGTMERFQPSRQRFQFLFRSERILSFGVTHCSPSL